MPDDRKFGLDIALHGDSRHSIAFLHGSRVDAAEAKEVEDKSVDDLVRKSVLLLEESADEDVGGTTAFATVGCLLRGDIAEAFEGGGGVQDRDRNTDQNRRDDGSFAQCACAATNEGKEEALEECGRLVEGLLEGVEEVDVELLRFVNILTDSVKNHHLEEALDNVRLCRDEDSSGLVASVGRPLLGFGNLDNVFPVRDGREDLEGLRKGSRLVSGQDLANSANWSV